MAMMLTDEEMKLFKTYKHASPKTTYEKFYTERALVPLEKLYPSYISANTLTLIGQVPVYLLIPYLWSHGMSMSDPLPDYAFIYMAFAI